MNSKSLIIFKYINFICLFLIDTSSEINISGDKDIAGLFHHYSVLMQKTLIRFSINLSTIREIRKKCSEESNPNDGETNVTLYLRVSKFIFTSYPINNILC